MSLIPVTTSIGCGAMGVSQKAAESLRLELHDDERLQQEAFNMGYPSEDLKGFDEKAPGLFDRLLRRRPEIYNGLMAASFTKCPVEVKVLLSVTGLVIF